MSHKLEVGERRSLASHYTLTTGYRDLGFFAFSVFIFLVYSQFVVKFKLFNDLFVGVYFLLLVVSLNVSIPHSPLSREKKSQTFP